MARSRAALGRRALADDGAGDGVVERRAAVGGGGGRRPVVDLQRVEERLDREERRPAARRREEGERLALDGGVEELVHLELDVGGREEPEARVAKDEAQRLVVEALVGGEARRQVRERHDGLDAPHLRRELAQQEGEDAEAAAADQKVLVVGRPPEQVAHHVEQLDEEPRRRRRAVGAAVGEGGEAGEQREEEGDAAEAARRVAHGVGDARVRPGASDAAVGVACSAIAALGKRSPSRDMGE